MTVNFLKAVPQQKARAASQETVGAMAKYNSGFTECAAEVGRYLGSVQGVDSEVRSRVLNHLSHRMNAIQPSHPAPHPTATHSQPSIQPVYVQIPNTTPVIPGVHTASYPVTTTASTSAPHHQGALVVMPSAVVLPTPVTVQHPWQQQQQQQSPQQKFVMPLSPPSSRGCSPVSSVSQTPVPVRPSAIQGVQKSSVPTNVDQKSEQLWRPWWSANNETINSIRRKCQNGPTKLWKKHYLTFIVLLLKSMGPKFMYIFIFLYKLLYFFEVLLPSLHVFGASILYATIYWWYKSEKYLTYLTELFNICGVFRCLVAVVTTHIKVNRLPLYHG